MLDILYIVITYLCTIVVCIATVPVLAGLYQFLLVAFSYSATHLQNTKPNFPRVSIVIPAWNESAVIGTTIENLLKLNYPEGSLRIYVVDDASTDETPKIVSEKSRKYFNRVFHVRREKGGQGKAHTLNYGLDQLWKDDWTQAVLIMDADVIYTRDSLVKMSRHLSDSKIGAVTAYIKEGSRNPNYIQRYIGFEYITATGVSRRAQNVMGFLACLSGGAQLHSRENLEAIGGKIFDDTLAEDTFTTFRTQLSGRKAIFEPNAIVYAEEPDSLDGLWKQRLRWARGNIQITQVYRNLWFRKNRHASMGSLSMGIIWFSIFLMPIFQISASVSLITLYFIDPGLSWALFRGFWIIAGVVYLVVTGSAIVIDLESAKKTYIEGILFPGMVSLGIIVYMFWPPLFEWVNFMTPQPKYYQDLIQCLLYAWLSLSMVFSYLAKTIEKTSLRFLSPWILTISGYGAFLCAVTFGAYMKELMGADNKWDKTIKTGKVG